MDKDLEQLKSLYQQRQPSGLSSPQEVEQVVKSGIQGLKRKQVVDLLMYVATLLMLLVVDHINGQVLETSTAGLLLLLGCAFYYGLSRIYLYRQLAQINPLHEVLETLGKIDRYKRTTIFINVYVEMVYVLILSLGVYLYLLPVLSLAQVAPGLNYWIGAMGAGYVIWILNNLVVLRRRRLKKELSIIDGYLQDLKKT